MMKNHTPCGLGIIPAFPALTPKRLAFFNPNVPSGVEGAAGGAEKPKETAQDTEAASREAVIVYNSNYRSLTDRIQQYSDSKNPRIREIAQKYMQRLNAEAIDPQSASVLKRNALQTNIKLISAIIADFSKEVRKASIEGPQRTKEDKPRAEEMTPGTGVDPLPPGVFRLGDPRTPPAGLPDPPKELEPLSGTSEQKEKPETLEQAYKRYELVLNANVSTIRTWIDGISKKDNPATENKDETLARLGTFADQMQGRFGGLTLDMFKDPAGVDRIIGSINDYMSKNVDPYYNGLMNKHREIMAQRNKEKKNRTA